MKNKIINKNLNTNNVITCDNLSICVGPKKNKTILIDDFNYAFEKGKVYAIIGNSGAGKSTLACHLNGLKRSNIGNIFVKDNFIDGKKRKLRNYKVIRKNVGLVFQFPESQIFKDSVQKEIMYGPVNYGVDKTRAKELASKYLNLVGIEQNLFATNPNELSNGQRRLLAIASILAIGPEIVILDEPTAGLDPKKQKIINDIISSLKKEGKTVIVITHNMDNVLAIADQVLLLHNNRLYANGEPYSIFTNKKLVDETGLNIPNVIYLINKLIKKDNAYSYLLTNKPKNIQELVFFLKKGGQ